jgi:hypothetical protein
VKSMSKTGFPCLYGAVARAGVVLATVVLAAGAGCASGAAVPADVRVPPDLLRGSPYTASGESGRSRYVVRMTDGVRDWEIQLPEIATAYEVKVPLSGKPAAPLSIDMAAATAADREIMAENQAAAERAKTDAPGSDDAVEEGAAHPTDRDGNREPNRKAARPSDKMAGGTPPVAKASYLLTLARVKDLYRTRHYELGLVELVDLEKQYPDDEHILSMKGSLYERLGNKNLAREAWQEALRLNPFNLAVLEALQRLGK